MSNINITGPYTIQCSKPYWSDADNYIAKCLDIEVSPAGHLIDVRIVSKKAFKYYLQTVFPIIWNAQSNAAYRKALFLNVSAMYDRVFNDFMVNYYPKTKYVELVGRDLYMHQKQTLATSIHRKNNLWALDMGTGKTLTAASLSKITGARRTVIVCPSLVKWNWFYDMTRDWGYNMEYWTLLDAVKSKSIRAFRERFVVLNYEQVSRQMNHLLSDSIDHIILDEAHYAKNHLSGRSSAVHKLIHESNNARLTMLTGTPVTNRIVDMFNYLRMSSHPLGKNFDNFKKLYTVSANVRGGKITGSKNIPDLKGKISNLMIRLRSEDCLDLPDMLIKNYYMDADELSGEYAKELQSLKEKKQEYDNLHGKEKMIMNTKIKNNIHTLNRLVSTSKVGQIKKLIDTLVEEGEKVIVFSGYKDPLSTLEAMLGDSCVKIDGSVQAHKRQIKIDRFINDKSCNVFLGNMQAAGIGINLVNARHVIFMNFPFTPDQIEQAQKRSHRSGQKRKVHVYYTIARGTIDEHIYNLIIDKSKDINMLIDGDHAGVINYENITGELFKRLIAAA